MACRGCSSDGCQCSIVGEGNGLTFTGSGTPVSDPYIAHLDLAAKLASEAEENANPTDLDPHIPALRSNGSLRMVPYPGTYTETEIDALIAAAGGGGGGAASGYSVPFVYSDSGDSADVDGIDGVLVNGGYDPDIGYTSDFYVSTVDAAGNDLTEWYNSFTRDSSGGAMGAERLGIVRVSLASNPSVYIEGVLINVYDQTTYWDIAWAFSHDGLPFTDGDNVVMTIIPFSDEQPPQIDLTSATYNLQRWATGYLLVGDRSGGIDLTLNNQGTGYDEWLPGQQLQLYNKNTGPMRIIPDAGVTIIGADLTINQGEYLVLIRSGTDDLWYSWGNGSKVQTVNAQTGTTYGFVLADSGSLVTFANAGAITATVPTNASVPYPIGTHIDLAQYGAGTVTIAAAGGVTINSLGGLLNLSGQYAAATLIKTGTNTWLLTGSLA